jgi:hypothetical protein
LPSGGQRNWRGCAPGNGSPPLPTFAAIRIKIGLARLSVEEILERRIAISGEVAVRIARVTLVELLIQVVNHCTFGILFERGDRTGRTGNGQKIDTLLMIPL